MRCAEADRLLATSLLDVVHTVFLSYGLYAYTVLEHQLLGKLQAIPW